LTNPFAQAGSKRNARYNPKIEQQPRAAIGNYLDIHAAIGNYLDIHAAIGNYLDMHRVLGCGGEWPRRSQ